jgi:glycosyltransferase involved in cell wall biosynthesis
MIVPNAIRLNEAVTQSSSGSVHVVFLGEVCSRKGTFLLLEAWAKMFAESPATTATLTIAGDGEVDRARDAVDSLAIQDSVDIRGWLSPAEVQLLLATTHVLVLPSLNEGQPMAILEAMARGICVLASRSGGISEMLSEESGVLIDPIDADVLADALRHVITDHAARGEFGTKARLRVKDNFDVDQVSRKFEVLYRHIAGR